MTQTKRDARERAREMMAAQRRAEARRKNMIYASVTVFIVIVAAGIFVGLAMSTKSKPSKPTAAPTAASASVLAKVTGVPAATLDTVGKGTATAAQPLSGNPVRQVNGKPSMLYVGAEYCPYCAAERWGMIVALSRFGTFSGLQQINSGEDNIPTFTFVNSTYTSQYLNFEPVEMYGNTPAGQNWASLQKLSADQQATFTKFNSQGSFPFVDFGNQAVIIGSSYQPSDIQGMTQDEIAGQLADPNSTVAKSIDGTANQITAQICKLTNNQPANVCSSKAVQAING